jgi:hypothetical protein
VKEKLRHSQVNRGPQSSWPPELCSGNAQGSWEWWWMPVVPATQEVEGGGWWAWGWSAQKLTRPYLKTKGLGAQLKGGAFALHAQRPGSNPLYKKKALGRQKDTDSKPATQSHVKKEIPH